MSIYANKYVVMMDSWIDAFPRHWPITYCADTLDEALQSGYFDGPPALEPRTGLRPELLQSTVLIYVPTATTYSGAVYLMHTG
jgi:hypothetical protein